MEATLSYEDDVCKHPKATLSRNSKGRLFNAEPDPYRTEFQRDVHRIIYSQPFRRLRHKTQVFFLVNNDHVCTRLEHCIYVASASRTVARHLGLNEDLAEAIGLGHDLGHAPFGHHGESVLQEIANKNNLFTAFHHEVNGLRVVDKLGCFDRDLHPGLNLTYEVRDGIISHNGEKFKNEYELVPFEGKKDLSTIQAREQAGPPSTLEGCVVRLVDKIAYASRDLEDGLRAKLIKDNEIPEEVRSLGKDNGEIVGVLLSDLIKTSSDYKDRICLSRENHSKLVKLIDFNYAMIYKAEIVDRYKKQATKAINAVFSVLVEDLIASDKLKDKSKIPDTPIYDDLLQFMNTVKYEEEAKSELIAFDFISGMTDNYLLKCLDEIFKPKSIV